MKKISFFLIVIVFFGNFTFVKAVSGPLEIQPTFAVDYNDLVEKTGKTWLELIQMVMPGLTADPKNSDSEQTFSIPRNIFYRNLITGEKTEISDDFTIEGTSILWLNDNGEKYLILLTQLGADDNNPFGVGLLSIFETKPDLKLIQTIDIKSDNFTDFGYSTDSASTTTYTILPIKTNKEGFFIDNYHWNSNQSYSNVSLVAFIDGSLQEVSSFFTLNSNDDCSVLTEVPFVQAVKSKKNFYKILMKIKVTQNSDQDQDSDDSECNQETVKNISKTYYGNLIWSSSTKKFIDTRKDFDKLDQFNNNTF